MSGHRFKPRFREQLPLAPRHEKYFRWRGREVSRLEGFADAVFAFAVTLLVVALEVPHTFSGLMEVVRGFPAFTVCFSLLMVFWNAHYRYFRRYGLEDMFTRIVSLAILLLVLFCVYPLKFLFGAILTFGSEHAPHIESWAQLQVIYLIYGLGFAVIWTLYAVLYWHALSKKQSLGLNEAEVLLTRSPLTGFIINIAICLLSVGISRLDVAYEMPGYVYMILGPALTLNGMWHGRRARLSYERAATPSRA